MAIDSDQAHISPAQVAISESKSRYRFLRRLGQGGMGQVWLAERTSAAGHVHKVAVKSLARIGSAGSLAVEALSISQLSHDNIVQFVDSWRDAGGRLFVAMSYVDGIDLSGLKDLAGLTFEAAEQGRAAMRIPGLIVGHIVLMVLRALDCAHTFEFADGSIGLVHRDVAPGNILIDAKTGAVKLTDFGITAAVGSGAGENGAVAGNIAYMSPEALVGDPVDCTTDIYSLGLVAYELLTGFNPNLDLQAASSAIGSITRIMMSVDKPLRPPHEVIEGTDPGLSRIVFKMLASKPEDRYRSAKAAIGDLVPYLCERGVGPTPESITGYLNLLKDRLSEDDPTSMRRFDFLSGPTIDWRKELKWALTPEAAKAVSDRRNPSRIG